MSTVPKTKVADRAKLVAFRYYLITRERWRQWTR